MSEYFHVLVLFFLKRVFTIKQLLDITNIQSRTLEATLNISGLWDVTFVLKIKKEHATPGRNYGKLF